MKIGAVIEKLEKCKPDARVFYNFGYICPTCIDSWRGSYDEPALGYRVAYQSPLKNDEGEPPTVKELLAELKGAIEPGNFFCGWKGDDSYSFNADSELHIDNGGESTGTELIDVINRGYKAVLIARENKEW